MAKFDLPFVDWTDSPEHGFWIHNAWDFEKGKYTGRGKLFLADHWKRILQFALRQDEEGKFPYTTVILSDVKKSGKTAISAAITAWYAEMAPPDSEIFICANSEDQSARLIYKDLRFHYTHTEKAKPYKGRIELDNGTTIIILTKNYTSNAGGRHGLVVFDELWGGTSEDDYRRWEELTDIPTVPESLRLVASYAGFLGESNLLHDIYLESVSKEEDPEGKGEIVKELDPLPCYHNGTAYFCYWNHEPRMPWVTDEYYDSQYTVMRPSNYLRLHENRWVTSNETFIPINLWEAAETHFEQSADLWKEHPYRTYPVYIGVDGGTKHDCTAIVGVTVDSAIGKVIVLFHKIWTPVAGDVLSPEVIEDYILEQKKIYRIEDLSYDPTQLVQVMTSLDRMGLPTNEFTQAESSMVAASQNLYDLLYAGNLWAYPAPDIKEHLQNAVAVHTSRGFRIVKDKSNRRMAGKKIDASIALAIATYRATKSIDIIGEPIVIESPFGSLSAWDSVSNQDQSKLPLELRT